MKPSNCLFMFMSQSCTPSYYMFLFSRLYLCLFCLFYTSVFLFVALYIIVFIYCVPLHIAAESELMFFDFID